jgi:aspartate ammonia-lyase
VAQLDPQILTGIQLFADLGPRVLAELAALAKRQRFELGRHLFRAGEPRTSLLYLSAGRVSISDPAGDAFGDQPLSYGPGDVLGEGVLIEGSRHTVDALASEPTEVWAFERDDLVRFFATRAEERALVLRSALQLLTRRLEQLSQQRFPELAQYSTGRTRSEHDLLGDREVPRDAYWGVQTARAVENFAVSGRVLSDYPELIRALALVKQAAARANRECGVLPSHIAEAIELACLELRSGRLHSQFVVDPIQGGAGTSTNMNANEVIANRALVHLGHQKGEYEHCHPNNHVNRSQSTNDVYPTALKLAMVDANQRLLGELDLLVAAFKAKGGEFASILKMGRTQLQDAVPMTLGQEFDAYARSIAQEREALESAEVRLLAVNMGGTAIGTGLTAPAGYAQRCVEHLAQLTGRDVRLAPDLIEATQDTQAFVLYSACLKSVAVKLSKIASDLRLLSSGPRAGLSEIFLPPMQPGSSIMPGKVNPVIPELVNQVAYKVIGNDLTVTLAAEAGQLQLNVMEPVIADAILESVSALSAAARTFRLRCVTGIRANAARCREYVERSIGVVTALVPILGYEVSTRLAARALAEDRGIVELVREEGLLSEERIAHLLAPERMVRDVNGPL